MSKVMIGRQFCGPPNSGNGGYVCGVLADGLAEDLNGPVTAVLRAPIPLDVDLDLQRGEDGMVLSGQGSLIGAAGPARVELPEPPPSPGLEAARAAGARHIGHTQRTHPICFTCGTAREDGDGLRVFAGPLEGAEPGVVACTWVAHPNFAGPDGTIAPAVVWAALDCPGYFAWVEKEGRHGALLGTMTGEILRRPNAGEECVLVAWPIARDGRKEIAGVAMYDLDNRLMARAHQVWIVIGPPPGQAA
ncbi:PaaI family thioesterase [Phenylobacterium sp.]|uniref:PaaI family thioesterase n=1 Tax=Phenylobacterium sp. TaxID=1871053 RepID=UPI00391D7C06